jgi:hypothetical protein
MLTVNRKTYRLLKELAPDVSRVLLKIATRDAPADAEAMVSVVESADLDSVLAELRAHAAVGAEVPAA